MRSFAFGLALASFMLSSADAAEDLNFAELIQPVPRHAVLEDKDHFVWGASVIQGAGGKYHMFYCIWDKSLGFNDGWLQDAEIAYAVSDRPDGPFTPRKVILRGRKHDGEIHAWDGASVYNPHIKKFGSRYYLYYVGTHDPASEDFVGNRTSLFFNQRTGVVIADSLEDLIDGRGTRVKEPLLKPLSNIRVGIPKEQQFGNPDSPSPANVIIVNPGVERRPDGNYLMVFKAADTLGYGPVFGVAVAGSPDGKFEVQPSFIWHFPTGGGRVAHMEDPYIWYDDKREKFFALVKDSYGQVAGERGLVLFESKDGIEWSKGKNALASRLEIRWKDGEISRLANLERPQLLFDETGRPLVLYCAAAYVSPAGKRQDGHTFNVHIPFAVE